MDKVTITTKDGFCIWALKKNESNKYIKVMEISRNDKYIYFRYYGGWSEKMSFENFNFYVNKLQEKTKESILLLRYLINLSREKPKK